jgi:transposase
MADYSVLTELLNLSKVKVIDYQLVGQDRINLFVEPIEELAMCPGCQRASTSVHETSEPQMIRDLALWDRQCWLRMTPRRFECSHCQNTFVERVAWREPQREYTLRYERHVYQRTRKEPIAQVAQDEQLSEEIVQGIFERWAKKRSRRGGGRR